MCRRWQKAVLDVEVGCYLPVTGVRHGEQEACFPVAHLVGEPGRLADEPRQEQVLYCALCCPDGAEIFTRYHACDLLVVLWDDSILWNGDI